MEYIKFIGLIFFTWLFAEGSAPLQMLKELINLGEKSEPKNTWIMVLKEGVNCSKCSGFWIGLIYYQDILLACIVSIASEIFSRIWNRWIVTL